MMMIALSLMLAASSLVQGPTASESASLWHDVREGQARPWHERPVSLSGAIVASRIGSVVLLPQPAVPNGEGGWQFDLRSCVGLMVSPEQFRRLRTGRRVTVRGTFLAVDLAAGDAITTSFARGGRRVYPLCTSADFVAPVIYVDRVTADRGAR